MKKEFLYIGALALCFVSCGKGLQEDVKAVEMDSLTLGADIVLPEGAKATVDQVSGCFSWQAGDQIDVFDANDLDDGGRATKYVFTLVGGAGTRNGVFSGEFPKGGTPASAVYPSSSGNVFKLVKGNFKFYYKIFDNNQWTVENETFCPAVMCAVIDNVNAVKFIPQTAVYSFTFTDIPEDADYLVLKIDEKKVNKNSSDLPYNLSGQFTVSADGAKNISGNYPTNSKTDNTSGQATIRFNFTPGEYSTRTFLFPINAYCVDDGYIAFGKTDAEGERSQIVETKRTLNLNKPLKGRFHVFPTVPAVIPAE